MRVYAREQVGHVWLVDPVAQTLEVYASNGSAWVRSQVAAGTEELGEAPFDALELELALLWER